MTTLLLGLLLFLGIHSLSIVAPSARQAIVARIGPWAWKGLYSVIAIAGFVLVLRGYAAARLDPVVLYYPPAALRHVAVLLMLPAFPMLLAAYLPGRIQATLKHPMLVATKLWASAHLLANGTLADVVLFGGFLAWAVADRISLKHRADLRIVTGGPPSRFNDVIAIALGLALYGWFVAAGHLQLIGVAPFAAAGPAAG
jgi:uncharacterized membrane protein